MKIPKVVVEIELTKTLEVGELEKLLSVVKSKIPIEKYGRYLVIISGRLPVWAFCSISHLLHPTTAVATFEPRLGAGIVVMSHTPFIKLGEVVSVDGAERISIKFPE